MGKQFEKYLSRRMMGEAGWMFFCVQCGTYRNEDEFAELDTMYWGVAPSCKMHRKGYRKGETDKEMNYLKLSPLKEQDFIDTQIFLESIGYVFGIEKTVHEQFMDKYRDKIYPPPPPIIDPFEGRLKRYKK